MLTPKHCNCHKCIKEKMLEDVWTPNHLPTPPSHIGWSLQIGLLVEGTCHYREYPIYQGQVKNKRLPQNIVEDIRVYLINRTVKYQNDQEFNILDMKFHPSHLCLRGCGPLPCGDVIHNQRTVLGS